MSICFTLTPKGEKTPAKFQDIDNQLREAFHQPPDAVKWLWGWYDVVGLGLACGKTWAELRAILEGDENLIAVVNWLEGRYDVDSWWGR